MGIVSILFGYLPHAAGLNEWACIFLGAVFMLGVIRVFFKLVPDDPTAGKFTYSFVYKKPRHVTFSCPITNKIDPAPAAFWEKYVPVDSGVENPALQTEQKQAFLSN